ncbi:uncharacterized protein K02A2.6-like [Rhopilema esculentum]|uniref:uncharacterized protein K02A2.6-like n=1 Tax=Rhopilema esculentum TaxID=499914 RepID=UPI0031DB23F5
METKSKTGKSACYRCGVETHQAPQCRFKDSECHFCGIKGHISKVCRKKNSATIKSSKTPVKLIHEIKAVNERSLPKLEVPIKIQGQTCTMELDTATNGNFISKQTWKDLGSPNLQKPDLHYESASKHSLPIIGTFVAKTSTQESEETRDIKYTVSEIPELDLLGRTATKELGISVDQALNDVESCHAVFSNLKADIKLQEKCKKLCNEFKDLWKPELGCLKGYELEVKFKPNVQPIFRKARPVPFAMEADLEEEYQKGITKGVWEATQFCQFGTPVVPIKKAVLPGQNKPKIRVCGDYSVTVNHQLEEHRHPLPLPEDLMRRLGGGYGFTKIDLADAYNQIKLAPESQRRLALSTHKGRDDKNIQDAIFQEKGALSTIF